MRITIVHNPDAGTGNATLADLEAWTRAAGYHARFVSRKDAPAVAAALQDPGDVVAVAGGDGSVRHIAQRLLAMGSRVPIAILPLGTANNIATTHGISSDCETLVHGWQTAQPVPFDVGQVRAPWGDDVFLEACGFGAIARTIGALTPVQRPTSTEDTEDELHRDLRVARELLVDHPLHDCRLTLDGREVRGQYAVVEVMNIPALAANVVLAPEASASDGQLDVVLVDEQARLRLRDYLTARLDGDGDAAFDIPVHRARRIRIAWEGSRIHIDDEMHPDEEAAAAGAYWGGPMSLEVDISVRPAALSLLLPPGGFDVSR